MLADLCLQPSDVSRATACRLGHTDIETTFTYLDLTKDSLEAAVNAIDEWNME